jgi:hypothetical protein
VTTVRVVVRDTRTGQYGSLDVPLRGLPTAESRPPNGK